MIHDKIKVAFIGAGFMTAEHLKAFSDIEGVKLAGIYSRTRSRSEALAIEFGIGRVCDSIEELYNSTQAHLLVISVPELFTREIVLKAFEFPWVCLIEKPVGYNLEEAEFIFETAKQMKAQAYVALNRRHYSSTRAVVEALTKSEGQRLVHVYDQENPLVALEGGTPQLVVDNWMYANSIHVLDYFNLFCRGNIESIEKISNWKPNSQCFVLSKLNFSSGDIGFYEAIWEGPGPWGVTITTPLRRWELRPLEQASFQDYKSRKLENIEIHPWDFRFKPGLRMQAEEALKIVRGEQSHLPTLEEGLNTMKLIKNIYGI
jgi:predicted dehydrogenase